MADRPRTAGFVNLDATGVTTRDGPPRQARRRPTPEHDQLLRPPEWHPQGHDGRTTVGPHRANHRESCLRRGTGSQHPRRLPKWFDRLLVRDHRPTGFPTRTDASRRPRVPYTRDCPPWIKDGAPNAMNRQGPDTDGPDKLTCSSVQSGGTASDRGIRPGQCTTLTQGVMTDKMTSGHRTYLRPLHQGHDRVRTWGKAAINLKAATRYFCPTLKYLPHMVCRATCFVQIPRFPPHCQDSQNLFIHKRSKNNFVWTYMDGRDMHFPADTRSSGKKPTRQPLLR